MKIMKPNSDTHVKITWMCGHCFKTSHVDVPWSVYQKSLLDDDFDESTIGWTRVCANCGCDNTLYRVDYDLSLAIYLLNTKGYLVFQSKMGTMYEPTTKDNMYVRFYQEIKPNDIPSLPCGWYMDDEYKSHDEVVIRPHINDPEDLHEKQDRSMALMHWVMNLPIYRGGSLPVIHIDSFDTPIGNCDLYLVTWGLYLIIDNDIRKIQKTSIYPAVFINKDNFLDPNDGFTRIVYRMIQAFSKDNDKKEEKTNE